jgi:hypothetical protein
MRFFNPLTLLFKDRNLTPTSRAPLGSYRSPLALESFCETMLKHTLAKVINDALLPLEILGQKDKSLSQIGMPFLKNELLLQKNMIFEHAKTLREMAMESLYKKVTIYKVDILNDHYYFFHNPLQVKGKNFKIGNGTYPILDAYAIDKPLTDRDILLAPFKLLYNYYVQIELYVSKSHQIFFKKHDLNKIFDGVAQPELVDELVAQARETYEGFMQSKGGIIDSKDSFEVPTVSIAGLNEAIDFAYKEISRLLGIPQSELLGTSPTGLNSAGVVTFSELSYEKRLNDYRQRLIEPMLKALDVEYSICGLKESEKLSLLKDFTSYGQNLKDLEPHLYDKALSFLSSLL